MTGKSFRLSSNILGVHSVDDQRTAVMIAEGGIVQVVSGSLADTRMVDVYGKGVQLAVFAEDSLRRSIEVKNGRSTSA